MSMVALLARVLAFVMVWVGLPGLPDGGALPMEYGVVQREPGWIIQNLGTRDNEKYYKLAEYTVPEGYLMPTCPPRTMPG